MVTDLIDAENGTGGAEPAVLDDMTEFENELDADGSEGAETPPSLTDIVDVVEIVAVPEVVETARPTVTVVIPTRNEALNLPYVAERMPPVDQIVVVDGASVDNTVDVARSLWPDAMIVSQTRSGKGNALACGFEVATGDIIVMIDADGSTDPAEIPDFVEALVSGSDLAKGSRFSLGGHSDDITAFRRAGNKGLNWLVNRIFATSFADLCYGYNAFWRRHLDVLDLPLTDFDEPQWGDGFEIETIINVRMARSGLKIREVGSRESKRIHGRSNLNALTDGVRVLRTIGFERRLHRDAKASALR